MFNFKKSKQESDIDILANYVLNNKTVYWLHSKYSEPYRLDYEKESDSYKAYFKMPLLDENGYEVITGPQCVGSFTFSPMYCFMNREQILTEEHWKSLEFNKTKVETLKELISKIEAL